MDKKREVVIYSTPNCPYCTQVSDYLKEKEIDFKEIDLSKEPEKAQQLVEKTGQMGVPVIIIKTGSKEKIVSGFNREELDKLL